MTKRMGNMMLKQDLEKTFDRLEWSFIRKYFYNLGFLATIVKLIMNFISTSFVSIMINGRPTKFFEPSRGIHQGAPLSPYIFIIYMQSLSYQIDQAIINSDWIPVKISRSGLPVSRLLFADDLILFARADLHNY